MSITHATDKHTPSRRHSFGFLLVPNYTAIGFTSAIETLRLVNQSAGSVLFDFCTITPDGQPVVASNQVKLIPDCSADTMPDVDGLFVCGPNPIVYPNEPRTIQWLQDLAKPDRLMGGICTGSYILAKAGLLDNHRCTIHWQDMTELQHYFPQLIISPYIFEIDRNRATCSGGTASMDMMLTLLRERYGVDDEIIALACDLLVHDRLREDRDRQRVPLRHRIGRTPKKLAEVVAVMEANIEEPLSVSEMASHVNVTARQLQRLFGTYLQCTPVHYYLQIRLIHANNLLQITNDSISDVAEACGFHSASYFSRRFQEFYGVKPTEKRDHAVDAPALVTKFGH